MTGKFCKLRSAARMELLVRWGRFNFVGGIGIFVQFLALFVLKSVVQLDYLVATALAVEAAVVHNFIWHERYTWAERVRGRDLARWQATSGAKAQNPWVTPFAALKRCATHASFTRFLRFNVTNGGVSIVGNLALMKIMVEMGQMNYLLANGIAIALCSLANFLVSENWVFGVDESD